MISNDDDQGRRARRISYLVGRSRRALATTALTAGAVTMLVAAPAALSQGKSETAGENGQAQGKPATSPGNSGSNPHGGAPGITGNTPSGKPAGTPTAPPPGKPQGKPTTPPGNSGSNPHGGPPGITDSGPPGQTKDEVPFVTGETAAPETVPNGPDGKITICHATGSETNPYVRITISVNGLNGHDDHQDGRDIIPAPDGPCDATASITRSPNSDGPREPRGGVKPTRRSGGDSSPNPGSDGSGAVAESAAAETDNASSDDPLPFTGLDLGWVVVLGAGLAASGLLVRRWSRRMS